MLGTPLSAVICHCLMRATGCIDVALDTYETISCAGALIFTSSAASHGIAGACFGSATTTGSGARSDEQSGMRASARARAQQQSAAAACKAWCMEALHGAGKNDRSHVCPIDWILCLPSKEASYQVNLPQQFPQPHAVCTSEQRSHHC